MSAESTAFYQAGIRCDHAGCQASIWRVAASRELASTFVQRDATLAGWSVARDRIYGMSRDLCPLHWRPQ